MTQKQFVTRKASLALLHPSEQTQGGTALLQDTDGYLQFGSRSGARLLVKPTAGGAIAARRQRFSHAAFCSVSTASAVSSSAQSDSRHGTGKHAGAGPDAPEQHARGQAQASTSLVRLPVAVKKGDQLLPYVWDGHRITAMNEAALQDSDVTTGRLRNWVLGLQRQLKQAFLPDPRDVTPDYWDWLRWRLSQRFFSSTMQNFSFSALLMATGLGAKKAFAASAAINWLLKDGVSRIVRMSVSTSFGQTFDADLKRMRFITSLIFTACMAGEFATPFWPHHFVALASISSVGRAVGLSAFVATQPAFQAALATGGNLADLTSKNQAQHMVMDMMALGVSAGLTWLCRGMARGGLMLPAIMYPICAAGDLTCIWHELKAVQLRTLNRERAEMVIERWMRRGAVPDAAEISAAESLVLPSDVWSGLLPLRITPLDTLAPASPEVLKDLLREYDSEQYVMHVTRRREAAAAAAAGAAAASAAAGKCSSSSSSGGSGGGGGGGAWRLPWLPGGGGGGGGGAQPEVLVSLSDRATPSDIAKALLHAAYLRKAVLDHFVTHGSDAHHRHHHHKQLHHHHHHHQGHHYPQAAAGALWDSAAPFSPEALLHHNHHNHNHHNPRQHQGEQEAKGGANAAPPPERDVANHHNGHHNGHHSGRDQFPGVHQLLERRQDMMTHHQQQHGAAAAADGGGGGSLVGHAHEHLHWDSTHQMLYRHNHYHTHQVDPGQLPAGQGHGQGQGGCGSATLAHARTASLSLSQGQGHANSSSSSSSNNGGPGCCAGQSGPGGEQAATTAAAVAEQQQQQQHQLRQQGPGSGALAARIRNQGATYDRGPAPEPRWEQLDETAWAALIRSSRREAERNLPRLLREAEQAGWKVKPFMLNTMERVQFVRL